MWFFLGFEGFCLFFMKSLKFENSKVDIFYYRR